MRAGTNSASTDTLTYDEVRPNAFNKGELTTASNDNVTYTYDYDPRGLVTTQTFTANGATYERTESYFNAGFTRWIEYPDGDRIGAGNDPWVYTATGKPTVVPELVTGSSYDARGQLTARDYANGVRAEWTYDAERGWLDEIDLMRGGTRLWRRTFTRDGAGRITSTGGPTEADQWAYYYDTAGRLDYARNTATDTLTDYSYDPNGNLTFKTGMGHYTYPAAGQPRPHAPTAIRGGSLTYDANGNLETVQGFAAINRTIVWDGLNRVSR
ncbi:hypothetical protein L1787_07325, partial [Acuticoccus sp. M5D2P5]